MLKKKERKTKEGKERILIMTTIYLYILLECLFPVSSDVFWVVKITHGEGRGSPPKRCVSMVLYL